MVTAATKRLPVLTTPAMTAVPSAAALEQVLSVVIDQLYQAVQERAVQTEQSAQTLCKNLEQNWTSRLEGIEKAAAYVRQGVAGAVKTQQRIEGFDGQLKSLGGVVESQAAVTAEQQQFLQSELKSLEEFAAGRSAVVDQQFRLLEKHVRGMGEEISEVRKHFDGQLAKLRAELDPAKWVKVLVEAMKELPIPQVNVPIPGKRKKSITYNDAGYPVEVVETEES